MPESFELFYLDENGKKQDAELHAAIMRESIDESIMGPIRARHRAKYLRSTRAAVHDQDWDESLHPRDKDGKFAKKGTLKEKLEELHKKMAKVGSPMWSPDDWTDEEYGAAIEIPTDHAEHFKKNAKELGLAFNELDAADFSEEADPDDPHSFFHVSHDKSSIATLHKPNDPIAGIDMDLMKKVGEAKGSNPGGVYEGPFGDKYYIKQGKSADHVKNELLAVSLYKLAGAQTMHYVPVKGDMHVATTLEALDKNNVSQFEEGQLHAVKKDFAIHAWLANWDAVGTGGDNQVVPKGQFFPVTVDVGGSLKYRAQGEPKGNLFGDEVNEISSLRNPTISPDAAKVFGTMTDDEVVASIKRVTSIEDGKIYKAVYEHYDAKTGNEIADKLVQRKHDLAKQAANIEALNANNIGPEFSAFDPEPDDEFAKPPVFKTKMEQAKWYLMKGTTTEELKAALGWPSIGVPKTAADLNLKLEKTKIAGGKFFYKGTPMTAQEIEAAKSAGVTEAAVEESSETLPGTGKIASKTEADTLAKVLKKTAAPNLEYYPAEKKGEKYQSTHSYATPVEAEHKKVKEILSNGGYDYTTYKSGGDKPLYGVQVPANYTVVPADKPGDGDTPTAVPIKPAPKELDLNKPDQNFEQMLINHGIHYSASKDKTHTMFYVGSKHDLAEQAHAYHPHVQKLSKFEYYAPHEQPTVVPVFPAPTGDELSKAKKSAALKMQYVPNSSSLEGNPTAEAHLKAFNDKWAGKENLDQDKLVEKVNDFKTLQTKLTPLLAEQQKAAAALAEQKKQQEKIAAQTFAEQKAAKLAAAAKAEAEALENMTDEEAHLYWFKKQIGESVYLTNAQDALSSSSKGAKLKKMGLDVAEVAYIKAFTGSESHYNEQMGKGKYEGEGVVEYKHIMNEALHKMDKYDGPVVYRKISIGHDKLEKVLNKYQVGGITEWKAFSSTSKNADTWSGNIHFVIKNPKTGVDVQFISSNPSEAEVIMPADSLYKVLSKTPNMNVHGKADHGTWRIELEEYVPFGKKKKLKKAA